MKKLFTLLIIVCAALSVSMQVYGVTDKEMEQAQTIAAQAYLRYANNGSGYLDDHKPTTMAELKKVLKTKEVENLKSFTAVSVPKDYASWDKAKLTEYWSVTFFKSPGLIEAGKGAKTVVRKRIAAMKVSDKPAAAEQPAANNEQPSEQPVSLVEETPGAADAAVAEMARTKAEADSIAAIVAADNGQTDEPKKKGSGTWVYVSILVVLIIVVVWLVVYASKTMSSQGGKQEKQDNPEDTAKSDRDNKQNKPTTSEKPENRESYRSEFAQTVARKNEEIRRLSKEIEDLGAEYRELERVNREVMGENARLTAETSRLDAENRNLRVALKDTEHQLAEATRVAAEAATAAATVASAPAEAPIRARHSLRTIYLGRVNARGLFVRADRTINPEATVFQIETEDGYTGRFQVVNLPEVTERALRNPTQWLAGGCDCADLLATEGVTGILTEVSGNAVFEEGCWRIVTKAKIRYTR